MVEFPYQAYQKLFSDVRNYEAFKNYFLSEAHWDVEKVREIRLWLTKLLIGEKDIIDGKLINKNHPIVFIIILGGILARVGRVF